MANEFKFVMAQVGFAFWATEDEEIIRETLEHALNIACTHVENSLKHESVDYTINKFTVEPE